RREGGTDSDPEPENPRTAVRRSDEDEARKLGGQRDRRVDRVRETHGLLQRDPEGRGNLHREGGPCRPSPRGRAEGAGADATEGPPRGVQPAGEAGGLPGAGSCEERAVHRGGSVGRGVRETRTPPGVPGDPSLAREDPERGEGPDGSDAE